MFYNVCKHCNQVFLSKRESHCCSQCMEQDNVIFDQIEVYLRQFPNSNAIQIADGLSIPLFSVLKYMDEGRLQITKGRFERLDNEKKN